MDATTSTAIEAWLDWAENRKGMRPSSVFSYRNTYVRLGDMIAKPLDQFTLNDLETYQRRPRGKGVVTPAPATLKREAAEIRHFFQWLRDRDWIAVDPSVLLEAPTVNNSEPKPLSDEDWCKVWDTDLDREERVMLGLGYFIGLRSAEMAWLRTDQFTWEPRPLISAMERKGGHHQTIPWTSWLALIAEWNPKLLPDPSRFIKPLQAILGQGGFVFQKWTRTTFVEPTIVGKRFKRVARAVGVDAHIHQLRHSFVTNQLRTQRVPLEEVSRNAGHRDVTTTMRYAKTEEDYIGSRLDATAILGWTPRAVTKWGS